MGYYNIVKRNIKLYLIVCEKLSPCPRAQNRGRLNFFRKIVIFGLRFSLYWLGYLKRF